MLVIIYLAILSFCCLSVSLHLKGRSKNKALICSIYFSIMLTSILYRQHLIAIFLICSHEEFFKKSLYFGFLFTIGIERDQWHEMG